MAFSRSAGRGESGGFTTRFGRRPGRGDQDEAPPGIGVAVTGERFRDRSARDTVAFGRLNRSPSVLVIGKQALHQERFWIGAL